MRQKSVLALVLLVGGLAACGRGGPGARNAEMGSFRVVGVGANADPTIRGARLLPESVDETLTFGSEAGGGTRVISNGLRVVTSPKGGIIAADERFPSAPTSTTALPERLGGGFLFVIGNTIHRADRWLGPAKPIFTSYQQMQAIIPGLDRVYVRAQNAVLAIDGRTGQVLDLGPWPASPYVASYAAVDGWRAAAVTDLRGVVATFDAGATWRALDLPFEPKHVVVSGDSLAIGGFENGRSETWYELRADGSIARLGAAPRDVKVKLVPSAPTRPTYYGGYPGPGGMIVPSPQPTPAGSVRPTVDGKKPDGARAGTASESATEDKEDLVAKTFGKRPLATAIEDGWPLTDGTAVIARDGALARVRLADGQLTEIVRDAFPLKPARCHPVSLTRPNAVGAFGFVCGEPRGTTVIYAYEPLRGRLSEIKRFEKPRVVTSSGNGALAVRGPCAEDGEPTPPPRPDPAKLKDDRDGKDKEKDGKDKDSKDKAKGKDAPASPTKVGSRPVEEPAAATPVKPVMEVHPYCVLGHDNTWREIHVRGDVGGERVVVLTDGRIVVVSPPQGPAAPARLTILDKGKATTVPIVFPRVTTDVARALRLGLWLDGFEERKPGVVGGWLEAGGTMLGLEIGLDGKAVPGQYRNSEGAPFVSGKYGISWTASQRGAETTDGGMTWTAIEHLPDPLLPSSKIERRACGPIGCLAHGWLRVGWGEQKKAPQAGSPPPYRSTTSVSLPSVQLTCEPLASMPPPPLQAKPRATPTAAGGTPPATPGSPPLRSRISLGGPPVLGSFNGLQELQPFLSSPAPTLHESDRGLNLDVRELFERYPNVGSLGKIYGWGPKSGDWDTMGRWQVKWLSPFAGWPEVRGSLPAPPPQVILDMTKMGGYGGYGYGYSGSSNFQLAPGDDPGHALLVGRRVVRSEGLVYELEADRAPVEIHRADGEPFGEIEGIVRTAGRWFIATPPSGASASTPATIIWQVEGAVARELVRVPRSYGDGNQPPSSSYGGAGNARTKLARRSDGRAIALVVEGAPTTDRANTVRWALPIDLETGALGEPEALGYTDLAGRTLDACADDIVGWTLDTAMASSNVRVRVPTGSGSISSVYARLRLTSARACIDRIAGTYDGQSQERAQQLTRAGAPATKVQPPPRSGEILASIMSQQTRFPLKCTIAK